MDLQAVRYFVAVAEELSFRRAAERLFVATPTVSAGIKRLETELGVRLFDRSSRSVRLTADGAALMGRARNVLTAADELVAASGRKRLVIGTLTGYGAPYVERVARELCPDLEIELRVTGWEDPTTGLRTRSVDAGILIGPSDLDDQLRRVRIGSEPRVAILPQAHPLAARDSVTLAEIDALGWVRVHNTDDRWHKYWRLDEVRGGPPREVGRVLDQPMDLLLAIRNGQGVCTTLESIRTLFSFEGTALVPVTGVPEVPIDLAFWPDRRRPGLDRFIAAARLAAAANGTVRA